MASATSSCAAPVGGLGELAAGVDPDPVVIGHAAAEIALGEHREHCDHAARDQLEAVRVPVGPGVAPAPAGHDEHDTVTAIPSQKCTVPIAERVAAQFGLRLALDEQAGEPGERDADHCAADDPGLGGDEHLAAEAGAPASRTRGRGG